ncbi:MAG: glutathione peroxidase [Betaproteobacteria bacterium]|nr:glutathione peroxidase [Betaproteobacteria bacterium]
MKRRIIIAVFGWLLATGAGAAPSDGCKSVLNYSLPGLLSGKPQSLCDYSGKVVLVVNTASQCGYTPQYEGLESLSKRYQKRGLVVIGFPSNDFGGQEPGSNKEVAQFCQMNYGVSFPMFEKTTVTGPQANPFYATLAQRGGGAPRWNFHKYLIDRSGNRVLGFDSNMTPNDPRLTREIERLLAESAP